MNPPVRNLAWWAKHHFGTVRVASFVLCSMPAVWLACEWLGNSLGINPLNRLLHFTGRWALIMLTVTLAVTPARRLSVFISQTAHARYGKRVSDWNWLIRLRRQFGLFSFLYAGLHLAIYFAFDAGLDVQAARDDIAERPFIAIGLIGFALLVPLALTSNQASMRLLGRQWRRLHTAAYVVALLALAHFWMHLKLGDWRAIPYTVAMGVLLASRLVAWKMGDRSSGQEVPERQPEARPAGSTPATALRRSVPAQR
jgi:methionine sulfoxide reductase heme-binding subunit